MKAGTKRRAREAAAAVQAAAAAARELELRVICRCGHAYGEHGAADTSYNDRCLADWDEGFCPCDKFHVVEISKVTA